MRSIEWIMEQGKESLEGRQNIQEITRMRIRNEVRETETDRERQRERARKSEIERGKKGQKG